MRTSLPPVLKSWLAVGAILVAGVVPVAAGVLVFVDPIGKDRPPEWVAVATLESLPADGVPRRVAVSIPRSDGWARLADEAVGYVFVRQRQAR